MTWRSKSKLRANAIKHGYRSGFEHKVSDQLKENKIKFEYETTVIPYIRPETKHTYTIDFTLPNGILIKPGDKNELKNAIKIIVGNENKFKNVNIEFLKKFSYEDFGDKMTRIYLELLKK